MPRATVRDACSQGGVCRNVCALTNGLSTVTTLFKYDYPVWTTDLSYGSTSATGSSTGTFVADITIHIPDTLVSYVVSVCACCASHWMVTRDGVALLLCCLQSCAVRLRNDQAGMDAVLVDSRGDVGASEVRPHSHLRPETRGQHLCDGHSREVAPVLAIYMSPGVALPLERAAPLLPLRFRSHSTIRHDMTHQHALLRRTRACKHVSRRCCATSRM